MKESELSPEVALERKQVWESRNLKTISNSQNHKTICTSKRNIAKLEKQTKATSHIQQDWQNKVVKNVVKKWYNRKTFIQ